MIPYFTIFLIVMIITVSAEKMYKKNKKISYVLSIIAITIVCIFAGYRAYSVGTDIKVYGLWRFNSVARFNNLLSYIQVKSFGTEYLYHSLNYVVYKAGGSFQTFLFILQLIPIGIVYCIAYKQREKGTFSLYILTYLLIWFNSSLNILRQTPAMFIILYAFKYIENKQYVRYIILVIIASLFHSSALICLMIPIIQYISKQKNKYVYLAIMVVITFAAYFSLDALSEVLVKLPLFNEYAEYIISSRAGNFKLYFALVKLVMLIVTLFYAKKIENKDENNLLIYLVFFDFVFYCSSAFIKFGYRISYYFIPFWILLIPRIDKSLMRTKARGTYRIAMIILLIVYWISRYMIAKYDGTIPYLWYS